MTQSFYPWHLPMRNESSCPNKDLYMEAHSHFFHNSQKAETQPKYPLTSEGINKLWHLWYTVNVVVAV